MLMQATWEQSEVDMRAPSAISALCSSFFCSASQRSGSFSIIPPCHDSVLTPSKLMCLRRSYWVLMCLRQMVGWNQASPDLEEEKGAHLDAWLHQTQIKCPLPCPHEVLLPVVVGTNLFPQHYQQPLLLEYLVVLEHLTLSYYFLVRTWYTFKWPTDINLRERSVTHPKVQSCGFLLHYQAQRQALWLSNCCLSLWWDQNPGTSWWLKPCSLQC